MKKFSKIKLIVLAIIVVGITSSINFIGSKNSNYDKISGAVNYNTIYKDLSNSNEDSNLSHIIAILNHIDSDMHADDFRVYREELVNLSYNQETLKSINKYGIDDELDNAKKYLGKVQLVRAASGQYKINNREYINKTTLDNYVKQILIKVNDNVK